MEDIIKELVELLEPYTELIGAENMVAIMDKVSEIKSLPDTMSADLANAVAQVDTLTADLAAEKAAREAAAAEYVTKLAKLLKGDIEDETDTVVDVEDKDDEVNAKDAYDLLF